MLALLVQITFAQDKVVKGVITDGASGDPLPGANVKVKGTNTGAASDFDGNYVIKANTGDILVFSYIGYKTVEKKVGASGVVNVTMQEGGEVLQTVEITAVGQIVKKANDLSSATKIKAKVLQRSGEQGVLQAMSGKTSGVQIVQNAGDPGSGAYIQIRGQNTITGDSSPLIIVDGVPVSNDSFGGGVDGVVQQSRLNDLNPNDIKKVEVLKGASAAAIYGTGAANGVIIITTKDGTEGKHGVFDINLRTNVTFDRINIEHKKQNIFGQGYPKHWYGLPYGGAIWKPNVFASWGDKIADRSGEPDAVSQGNKRFVAEDGTVYYPITDKNDKTVYNGSNKDQVFGTGMVISNDFSLSYSTDKTQNFFSFSNWDQQGIIKGRSDYHKKTLRLNNTTKFTDKLTFKFKSTYANNTSKRIQQGSNLNGLYLGYLRTPPDFDNSDYLGTYYDSNNVPHFQAHRGFRRYLGDKAPIYNNPGWTIHMQRNPVEVNRVMITPELNYKLTDAMGVTLRYGLDYYTDNRETFFPVNSAGDTSEGSYSEQQYTNKIQTILGFINGNTEIGDNFDISYVLGTQFDMLDFKRIGGGATNFANPIVGDILIFNNTTNANKNPGKYIYRTRKSGVYGVLTADLFDQIVVELGGRYERPSTVKDAVFYPTASFGWKFSNALAKDNDILNFGKLRFSYGQIGIEPGAYLNKTVFGMYSLQSSWGDHLDSGIYGAPFARSSSLGNPDLKVETKTEYEGGIDLVLFNKRINLGATYYQNKTIDAILPLDRAPSSGYSQVYKNAASISNKGIELDLGAKIVNTDNFKWNLNLNWSTNKNMVESLSGVKSVSLNGFTGTSSRVVEGQPFGTLWGGKFLRDDNGKLVLDSNGFPQASPEKGVIGDPNPDWLGGLTSSISYKGFRLNVALATSQGGDMWGGTEGVLKFFGISPDTAVETTADTDLKNYADVTIPAGTTFRGSIHDFGGGKVALDVDWYTDLGGGFGSVAEQFVQDASWTKLRELSLYYQFPSKLLSKTFVKGFEIGVTGKNLFTWTKFEGVDPELNLTGASKGRGLDYFTNPGTRTIMVSTNIKF